MIGWWTTNGVLRQRLDELTRVARNLKEERDQAVLGKENEVAYSRAEITKLNSTILNLKSEVHDLTEILMTMCVQAQKIVNGGTTEPSAWRGDWMWDRVKLPSREVIHQQIIGRLRVLQNGENDQQARVDQLEADVKKLKLRLSKTEEILKEAEEHRDHFQREATHAYGMLGIAQEAQRIDQLTAAFLRKQYATLAPEFKSLKAEKAAKAVKSAAAEPAGEAQDEVPLPPSITPPKDPLSGPERWPTIPQ